FNNSNEGLVLLKNWLKAQKVTFDTDTLLVIENTGIYHRLLWKFFSENNIPIHIGNAAHIKKSFGIARGKNDKIDSQRLCNYAYKNDDELKATAALNPVFLHLKDLITSRTRLNAQLGANRTYLGRYTHKVAISNHRICSINDEQGTVTFDYKDYADEGKQKQMTLAALEFIRRFEQHILPERFTKIRTYGYLANRNRHQPCLTHP